MKVINLRIEGLKLIEPFVFHDERGFFKESYHASRYEEIGIPSSFPQDNHSFSKKNVIRGMHFQRSPGQNKLVWVTQGTIYDVAVDLRADSPTFGQWQGVYLDHHSQHQFFIPAGFAHGFCVVSDGGAHVHYKVSTFYEASKERAFRYDDCSIGIEWPVQDPIVSNRDREAPSFEESLK